MQETVRPEAAAFDPRWPRLRALRLDTLRLEVDAPDLGGEGTDGWSALLTELRRAPQQAPLLTRVVAWGLPDDDLLGWALLAARLDEALRRPPQPSRALLMAERWMRGREEADRHELFAVAQAEVKPTSGTLAGYAAFSSGSSLSPPDEKPAPPPPGLARGASSAVLPAAAAAINTASTGRGFDAVNLIGLDLAAGGDGRGWRASRPQRPAGRAIGGDGVTIILRLFDARDPGRQLDSRVLSDGELRIGRDAGQDWSLDDPGRLLSRAHLVVAVADDRVKVTDVSSNGVFNNADDQRLPQGRPAPLPLGSSLRFGPYLLSIERAPEGRAADTPAPAPAPRGASPSPFGEPDQERSRPSPFGSVLPDDPFDGGLHIDGAAPSPRRPGAGGARDGDAWERPRERRAGDWDAPSPQHASHEHLIGSPSAWSQPPPPPAAEVGFGFDAPFSQPLLRKVDVARGDLAIPSDWDEPPQEPPAPQETGRRAAHSVFAPAEPVEPAAAPPAEAFTPAAPAQAADAPSAPDPLSSGSRGSQRGAPEPSAPAPSGMEAAGRPSAASDSALLAAFCRGAKLNATAFAAADGEEVMARLGVVYRAMILGMSDLMGERTSLKNEYRMVRTTISSERNNPFKWLPPQAVAAELLLQSQEGFTAGPEAVTEAFVDLKKHLLCLLAGLRAALGSTLDALEPSQVEEALRGQPLLMKNRGAAAWSEYARIYGAWRREADDNPDSPVNRAFRSAYERQLAELDRLGSA